MGQENQGNHPYSQRWPVSTIYARMVDIPKWVTHTKQREAKNPDTSSTIILSGCKPIGIALFLKSISNSACNSNGTLSMNDIWNLLYLYYCMIYGRTIKLPEVSCQELFHNILKGWNEIGDYM